MSCLLKTTEFDVARMSSGSAFQAEGPACEKARSPSLVRRRGSHHHHVRLFKTMTKSIVKIDKTVNESIGPFKKHAGNKIAVIIITRFSSNL